jgi:hypothetical protein
MNTVKFGTTLRGELAFLIDKIRLEEGALKAHLAAVEARVPSRVRGLAAAAAISLACSFMGGFPVFSLGFVLGWALVGLFYNRYTCPTWNPGLSNPILRACLAVAVTGGVCWLVAGWFGLSYMSIREGILAGAIFTFFAWFFATVRSLFGGLHGK